MRAPSPHSLFPTQNNLPLPLFHLSPCPRVDPSERLLPSVEPRGEFPLFYLPSLSSLPLPMCAPSLRAADPARRDPPAAATGRGGSAPDTPFPSHNSPAPSVTTPNVPSLSATALPGAPSLAPGAQPSPPPPPRRGHWRGPGTQCAAPWHGAPAWPLRVRPPCA
jgi:hypothetical protein